MYIYTARRRCRFRNVINWWYLPIALVKLAALIAGVALIAVCACWPLWVCAGIVGLI